MTAEKQPRKSSTSRPRRKSSKAFKHAGNQARKRAPKNTEAAGKRERAREEAYGLREKARVSADKPILVFGRPMRREDLFRLAGLAAFFLLMVVVVMLIWPLIGQFFDADGRSKLLEELRNAGPLGVPILLGIQVLQVVVAFIPGEVVQMVAGAMYGPVGGMLIVLAGCLISSFIIYEVVHRLGQPFVEAMVPIKYLDKFREFEENGRLEPLVFILFLIPGLPKDTFTYLVPLTHMPRNKYLAITTLARIPGVFMSTFAASGLMDGNLKQSIIVIVVLAVLAGLGLLFKDRIIDLISRR